MDINNTTELGKVKVVLVKGEKGDAGDAGDYAGLTNKPSINNVELSGDKTSSDLGLASLGAVEDVASEAHDEVEALSADVYHKSETYTKTEIDAKFVNDADDASAKFRKNTVTAPTSRVNIQPYHYYTLNIVTACPINKFLAITGIDTLGVDFSLIGFYYGANASNNAVISIVLKEISGNDNYIDANDYTVSYLRLK